MTTSSPEVAAPLEGATVLEPADVMWREVAGETVILDARGSVIVGLNGTGGRVWQLLDGKRSLASVAADIASRHVAAPGDVLGDVLAFAATLVERRLARRVAAQVGGGDQR